MSDIWAAPADSDRWGLILPGSQKSGGGLPLQMDGSFGYPKGFQRASTLAQRSYPGFVHAAPALAVQSEPTGGVLSDYGPVGHSRYLVF